MIDSIHLKSYSKLNLGLDIIDKYQDGYHNLNMIMVGIDFYDEITIEWLEEQKDFNIQVSSDNIELPLDESNFCYLACEKLLEKYNLNKGTVKIFIKKNIPMGAGLGGGSSNAATVLIALSIMFNINISISELQLIGSEIGSDVAFLVANNVLGNNVARVYFKEDCYYSFALAKGRGDILEKLPSFCFDIVLVLPEIFSSTAEVYSRVNIEKLTNSPDISILKDGIIRKDISLLSKGIGNVLREPAEHNKDIRDVGEYISKKFPRSIFEMSGSGSSFFIIPQNSIDLSDFKYKYILTKTLSF